MKSLDLAAATALPMGLSLPKPLRTAIALWGTRENRSLASPSERMRRVEAWLSIPLESRLSLRRFTFSPWGMATRAVGMMAVSLLTGMVIFTGMDVLVISNRANSGLTDFIGGVLSLVAISISLVVERRLHAFAEGPTARFIDLSDLRFAHKKARTAEEYAAILFIKLALTRANNPDIPLERVRVELGEADLHAFLHWTNTPETLKGGELSELLSRMAEVLNPISRSIEAPRMQTVWH